MFAYCNNCPVLYVDICGSAPWPTTKVMSDCRALDPIAVEAYRIAYQEASVTERYLEIGKNTYKTYDVAIDVANFSEALNDENEPKRMDYFCQFLYQRIQGKIQADAFGAYYTMSLNHIYAETQAHICVWDISFGMVKSTEVINLNVDEDRIYVLPFMYFYGYDGKGGEYTFG